MLRGKEALKEEEREGGVAGLVGIRALHIFLPERANTP